MAGVVLALILIITFRAVYSLTGGFPEGFGFSGERYQDVTLLYSILPGYLLAMSGFARLRTQMAGLCFGDMRLVVPRWVPVTGGAVGLLYGFLEFRLVEDVQTAELLLEWTLRIGSGLIWASTGLYAAWRIGTGVEMLRSGRNLSVSIWNREKFRPVARMAILDVFVAMGALALMPLQSISSDFQWVYYQAGFAVGVPVSVVVLLLPMAGIRSSLAVAKSTELDLVNRDIQSHSGSRVELELLLAYRDRVLGTSPWPMDMKLMSRAAFYLVIPPLAWVGAALVERLVEQFV